MSNIRSKNTSFEVKVFQELRQQGIYFQKHYNKALGKPDIALPRKKIAVFLDGDFWHGWRFNQNKKRLPKKYWLYKIESNIKRDQRNRAKLRREGWKVLRIWEHEVKKRFSATIDKIINFLNK